MSKFKKMKERYNFFLNPHSDCVFSKCPKCEIPTRLKKLPLTIAIKKIRMMLNLNKTCRFCRNCELLIVKKNEVEEILFKIFGKKVSDKEYFILGTIEKSSYVDCAMLENNAFLDKVYLFKNQWNFEPNKLRWMWGKK